MKAASCAHRTRLIAGFFIACLPLQADSVSSFTVTEARPILCKWEIDGKPVMVSCAYITHLFVRAKRGCPECNWKSKSI